MSHWGILIIAHGSTDPRWVDHIDRCVEQVQCDDLPITVGFLELVPSRDIEVGVRSLEQAGVTDMIVVPLFVSSGSTHLEEIRYALGLAEASEIETELLPIHPQATIHWCDPMDEHPLVVEILGKRIRSLSAQPSAEALLLVGHGSDLPSFEQKWDQTLTYLTNRLQQQFGFAHAGYATLYPDTTLEKAQTLALASKLIVIPIFISPGYLTSKVIPKKLHGLNYEYNGETYLPHPNVSRWIETQVRGRIYSAQGNLRF